MKATTILRCLCFVVLFGAIFIVATRFTCLRNRLSGDARIFAQTTKAAPGETTARPDGDLIAGSTLGFSSQKQTSTDSLFGLLAAKELPKALADHVFSRWYEADGQAVWAAWAKAAISAGMTRDDLLQNSNFIADNYSPPPTNTFWGQIRPSDWYTLHFDQDNRLTMVTVATFNKMWGRPSRFYLQSHGVNPDDYTLPFESSPYNLNIHIKNLAKKHPVIPQP